MPPVRGALHVKSSWDERCKSFHKDLDLCAGADLAPVWRSSYFWILPRPHHFAVSCTCSGSIAAFDQDLAAPALSYLWQHQVCIDASGAGPCSNNVPPSLSVHSRV